MVIFLFSIVALALILVGYLASKANRTHGGRTYIEIKAAGLVLKFGTEINGSSAPGVRSADTGESSTGEHEQGQLKVENPPPVELPPGRRRKRRPPSKRAPDGGEA
ncbi:hypothetical protein [Actinoplanes sp. NPDC048796]|uniref:hypothetical protein n=1 Tax=Actinoplanes sp. NPDC048796 TaxID=3155640 RepID=UPI0033EA6C0D